MRPLDGRVERYCAEHEAEWLDELRAWIAIPSISADPAHAPHVRRCAEAIVARMSSIGLRAELLETGGNPLAYGEWLGAPNVPTAIIYGHYDVQPDDPIELWTSPPFDAQIRDGNLYGRGAVDDKGQVLMHLAAMEAHLRANDCLPINIKMIVEGEEEIGSPNFEAALAQYRNRFSANLAVISDTAFFSEAVPSLTTSMRGLVHWQLTVHGPAEDLHSGYFGGIIRNPIEALAQIIARLRNTDGSVAVPGFYDGVRELDESTAAELRTLEFNEAAQATTLGVEHLGGEASRMPLERMWFRPTLECNGIWGGYQGPGAKTIIPQLG